LEASEQLLARAIREAHVAAGAVAMYGSSVHRGLHQLARERRADLLVVGSCSRGKLGRLLFGNDTISALKGAPCAVAIAPRGYASSTRRLGVVGIGSDGSPES